MNEQQSSGHLFDHMSSSYFFDVWLRWIVFYLSQACKRRIRSKDTASLFLVRKHETAAGQWLQRSQIFPEPPFGVPCLSLIMFSHKVRKLATVCCWKHKLSPYTYKVRNLESGLVLSHCQRPYYLMYNKLIQFRGLLIIQRCLVYRHWCFVSQRIQTHLQVTPSSSLLACNDTTV